MKKIKLIPTLISKYLIKLSYMMCCFLFQVKPTKITFASSRSLEINGNLAFIEKECKRQKPDYQYVHSFYKREGTILGKISYIAHILKDSYHLATSRYFIIDDYHFSVYVIKPRKQTEIIQLWHACGAFKKFGMSILGKPYGPSEEYLHHVKVHSNYSRVYVSSQAVVPFYAEAFDMKETKIYPLGVPRTDYFYQKQTKNMLLQKLAQYFPNTKGKELVLYAPTFRGNSGQQRDFHSPIDFSRLLHQTSTNKCYLIHLHPYMKAFQIDDDLKENVVHITSEFTIEELLLLADRLITDYSSIVFDYCLLTKPVAFYAHDLEAYIKERDFYYDYTSFVPGPILTNTDDLCDWLENETFDKQKIRDFQKKFFDFRDGKASQRIVSHLFEHSN